MTLRELIESLELIESAEGGDIEVCTTIPRYAGTELCEPRPETEFRRGAYVADSKQESKFYYSPDSAQRVVTL